MCPSVCLSVTRFALNNVSKNDENQPRMGLSAARDGRTSRGQTDTHAHVHMGLSFYVAGAADKMPLSFTHELTSNTVPGEQAIFFDCTILVYKHLCICKSAYKNLGLNLGSNQRKNRWKF